MGMKTDNPSPALRSVQLHSIPFPWWSEWSGFDYRLMVGLNFNDEYWCIYDELGLWSEIDEDLRVVIGVELTVVSIVS